MDPQFVDPANDDYHLLLNSPCIDAGDPTGDYTGQTDIDGEPRVINGRVDIGADEYSGASIPTLKWPLAGDIDDRQILLGFGDIWTHTYCGGLPKKHTGVDLKASAGEDVYAPEAGTVKAVLSDSNHPEWKYCVTIEHSGFTS
ncbi:unnamed protein product, partial [marine sediment metagenome]